MARSGRVPGRQADQYDWISAYLYDRGLQRLWRVMIFTATVLLAASTALMTFSPEGPDNRLTTIICFVAAGSATGAADLDRDDRRGLPVVLHPLRGFDGFRDRLGYRRVRRLFPHPAGGGSQRWCGRDLCRGAGRSCRRRNG